MNKQIWDDKMLLLQALRWRIERPFSTLSKREAVLSYTIYDVLGLNREDDKTLLCLIHSQSENMVL